MIWVVLVVISIWGLVVEYLVSCGVSGSDSSISSRSSLFISLNFLCGLAIFKQYYLLSGQSCS